MIEKIHELLEKSFTNVEDLKLINEAIKTFSKYYDQSNQMVYFNELPDVDSSIEKMHKLNEICMKNGLPLFYEGNLTSNNPSDIAQIDKFLCSLVKESLLLRV